MHTLRIKSLLPGHLEQRQQYIATSLSRAWPACHAKRIAATGNFYTQSSLNLSQVFIKLTAQVGKAVIVGGLENHVPRNLDSIQDLYLKPLCRTPPAGKTGAMPCRVMIMAKNLSRQ